MKITNIHDIFKFFNDQGQFVPYAKGIFLCLLTENNEISEEQFYSEIEEKVGEEAEQEHPQHQRAE